MRVLFTAGKGGTGRTTLAFLTAAALTRAGRRVAVREAARDRPLLCWVSLCRAAEPWREGERYDFVLEDGEAGTEGAGGDAVDRLVVAAAPGPMETAAAADRLHSLPTPPAGGVLLVRNRWRGPGAEARDALCPPQTGTAEREDEGMLPGLDFTPAFFRLPERRCYREAWLGGWGRLSAEAKRETRALAEAVTGGRF